MPSVPPVVASFLREFSSTNDLEGLDQSVQFEHLLAHLLFRVAIHDRFVTDDVVTGKGETGIDGACVVLDGNLILTADDAEQFFTSNRPSSSVVAELYFFQSKLSQSFSREGILGFGTAVAELLGESKPETPQDEHLLELRSIYEVMLANAAKLDLTRAACRLYYCCLGEWKDPQHPAQALKKAKADIESLDFFSTVVVKPVDRNDVRMLWNEATRAQEATLSTVARFPFPAMPGVANAVIALVRATDFVDSLVRDKAGNRRTGIFDQNIRDFEGLSNPVNEKIRATLVSPTTKGRFGVMNNGVTIIAKKMQPAADTYVLTGYQIVNGCQTSNVLERNREALTDDVLLQVRLIQTASPDVLNDVVEATNSQTTVPDHQFVANSKAAVETQEFFGSYPENFSYRLHFERRKSEFAEVSVSNTRIVTIQDLARTYGAVFLEEPHLVASAPNQAFAVLRDRLFQDGDLPLMYYTAAFAHYRLFLLKVRGELRIPQHRLYWHVLTAAKRIAAGRPPAPRDRKRMEKYCETFLRRLWEPTDALKLFEEAHQAIVDNTTQLDRDRLRRQVFTSEYLNAI